ncbi:MAG: hypothetical protein BGO68_03015 [Candidatus Amoebophilus sp. 36-38]|nr:MAG: hypothetical protein BGO68_03015 [Candidatus Amoebophilus sp. 36-38]
MGTQRYTTFSYKHLDEKFTESTCTVDSIDLPDMQRSNVVNVSQAQDPGPVNYHTSERMEIVTFTVTYIPHDSTAGKELLPFAHKAVNAVLEKNYKPEVAIVRLGRNEETDHETTIHDCIITGAEIAISESNNIQIIFTLQGILNSEY